MTTLLPCPFKHKREPTPGSELNDEREVILVPWLEEYAVVCTWCGALGPYHNTEEEAIEAWNSQTSVISMRTAIDLAKANYDRVEGLLAKEVERNAGLDKCMDCAHYDESGSPGEACDACLDFCNFVQSDNP